ncbi:MAG: GNAT family N-acetyltransferase, partial [Proteobacteria bacterium]|nr:GNAT family N-acetyltransferase [Pseudomonadota bacterium]
TCREGSRVVGVLPAYRYEGPLGAILVSCAQAGPLGGVACHAEAATEPVYAALIERFLELAVERGCALATLISNPFWPDADLCRARIEPDFELENVCQVLDLDDALDGEGQFVRASSNLRRNLRKAHSGKLRIDDEQSRANVEEWWTIHDERHREIGAVPLPRTLFTSALEEMVPRDRARFFFVRKIDGGEMIAGGFYVCHGSVMDAVMPSLRTRHANLAPNFLLASHTIRWARERGVRYYNWQPSPPDGGVARFKRQWGSRDHVYAYLTRITGDEEPFLRSTVEEIRAGYPWHYVLPFDRVGQPGPQKSGRGRSTRHSAWSVGEGAQ